MDEALETCQSVFQLHTGALSCFKSATKCSQLTDLLHKSVLVVHLALVVPSFLVHLKSLKRDGH